MEVLSLFPPLTAQGGGPKPLRPADDRPLAQRAAQRRLQPHPYPLRQLLEGAVAAGAASDTAERFDGQLCFHGQEEWHIQSFRTGMAQHVLPVAGDFYIFTGVDRLQRGGRAAGTAPLDARSPDLLTGSGAVRNCLLNAVAPFP